MCNIPRPEWSASSPLRPVERQVAEGILSGRRVLIVEDEMLIVALMEDMMAELGCLIHATASSASAALALVADQSIDLATLDLNIYGGDSYAVADVLTARGIPFLFVTGYTDHRKAGYEGSPLLRKPFSVYELESALRRLLLESNRGAPP